MKKVLILAYDFPPYVSVGGIRPYNWFKYFKEHGIEPVVVTRQWSNKFGDYRDYVSPGYSDKVDIESNDYGTILKTPYKPNLSNRLLLKYGIGRFRFIRRAISAFFELGQYVFPFGTKYSLYKAAKNYMKQNQVDAVIASVDPFILFRYASKLGKKFDVPWIADYRDPWTIDPTRNKGKLIKIWDGFWERKIVKSASVVVTVSSYVKELIRQQVKKPDIVVINNGYDPMAVEGISKSEQNRDKLSIGFAGTIQKWDPIESFLETCHKFILNEPDIKLELNFFGINNKEMLMVCVEKKFPELEGYVKIHPKTINEKLLRMLAANNMLLLFNYYIIPGTKIFDYIALNRKILFCYTNDTNAEALKRKHFVLKEINSNSRNVQAEILERTQTGIMVKDGEMLLQTLTEKYNEWSANGAISCESIHVEQYSRKSQTGKLAELIKNIT